MIRVNVSKHETVSFFVSIYASMIPYFFIFRQRVVRLMRRARAASNRFCGYCFRMARIFSASSLLPSGGGSGLRGCRTDDCAGSIRNPGRLYAGVMLSETGRSPDFERLLLPILDLSLPFFYSGSERRSFSGKPSFCRHDDHAISSGVCRQDRYGLCG